MSKNPTSGEQADRIVAALENLGLNGAATNMGAIELLALEVKAAGESITAAINDLADAVREPANH